MKLRNKIIAVVLSVAVSLGLIPIFPKTIIETQATVPYRDITAEQVVADMGIGWNLGNTFDAYADMSSSYSNPINGSGWNWILFYPNPNANYADMEVWQMETALLGLGRWDLNGANAVTTQSLIQRVKALGFDTIRIPVTWNKVIVGDYRTNTFTIRADWLNRIKQVVDWAIEADLYVVLNVHHDEYILPLNSATSDTSQPVITLSRLWNRICQTFNNDYDERLIFEVLNEPRVIGHSNEWSGGLSTHRQNLNRLNQAAVNAIRATGGNNRYRVLMIPTYAASHEDNAFNNFVIPTDNTHNPSINKMILSVHVYEPAPFVFPYNANHTWNTDNPATWSSTNTNDTAPIITALNRIQSKAQSLGVPVVIGEWGAVYKNNPIARRNHAQYFVQQARNRGMATIVWDNGDICNPEGVCGAWCERFGIIERKSPHNVQFNFRICGISGGGICDLHTCTDCNKTCNLHVCTICNRTCTAHACTTAPCYRPCIDIPCVICGTITIPTAPQNFTATPGDGQITLNWTAPSNNGGASILGYLIERQEFSWWTSGIWQPSNSTSHTITGLTNGKEYTFRIYARNSAGNGEVATVTVFLPIIAKPQLEIKIDKVQETDVIKITNNTDKAISTKGLYISDNGEDLFKWQMPSFIIRAGQAILIKSENDNTTQTLKRAIVNFDVPSADVLQLTNADKTPVTCWSRNGECYCVE